MPLTHKPLCTLTRSFFQSPLSLLLSSPSCCSSAQVRLHCPPRLPRKVVHAMRHASAKLFTQMGCKDVARVSGWAVLQPGWNDRYRRTDVDILPLIDPDAGQMDKLATRLAEV